MDYIFKPVSYKNVRDTVDRASFRSDSEMVRSFKFNPQGERTTPVYDYNDGQIPKDDTVTPEILALRSGKLDKADIDYLKNQVLQNAKNDSDAQHAQAVVKALDEALGIAQKGSEQKTE